MIHYIKKPNSDKEIFSVLNPLVAEWFKKKFNGFCESQRYAIIPIHQRKNILVSAPTGSGKTLCAFSSILSYLITLAEKNELENKVYAVYVSPLKALNNDIKVNLINPLKEIYEIAHKKLQEIRISVRTGDTESKEKTKMLKKAPHILITTPESLAIILSSKKFIEKLKAIEFVIVDEIHALACNKRGTHLSLSLERLQELSAIEFVRIGLSATIAPLFEVARFLVGFEKKNGEWKERDCLICDIQFSKKIDLKVLCPIDFLKISAKEIHEKLYSLIDFLIKKHKTTLIFTNTRSATERVVNHLKEKFSYYENIGAHHSSLSKKHRFNIEERLREGKLKVVVCSTSLELGIDIGYIDLVILLGSPKSVARAMQRIGRSGHKLHDVAKGRFIVLDLDDLVECSVLLKEALNKKIDKIQIPKNCLDVLAQQIYGMAIYKIWDIEEIFSLIKKSYCYHNLSRQDFFSVISYLSGEYALEEKNVYARIWYDPETKKIGKKGKLARMIYMTNIGTIPEESFVNVVIAKPPERKDEVIGKIDEAFLEKLRRKDVFVLGGHKYEFLYSRGMNIYVNASVKKQVTIPSWFSEILPLSFDLAISIQQFRKIVNDLFERKKGEKEIINFISDYLYIDKNSSKLIYDYFYEQFHFSKIPHINRLIIEHYKDNKKHYIIFHSCYGRRVNDALSRAIAFLVARFKHRDIEIGINDNGFFLSSYDKIQVERALRNLNEKNIQEILEEAIEKTEMFKRRFRHCATRSLMILRKYKGKKKTIGKQQLKSGFLLSVIKKIDSEFSVLKETRREILEDIMDIENAKKVLKWIKEGKIKIQITNTDLPSPFSLNLITQGYADLLKIENKIEFLKRMHEKIMERIR